MGQNIQENKEYKGIKRKVGDKIHYYDYKGVIINKETHQELRKQSKENGMSMPKYIWHLLQKNKQ